MKKYWNILLHFLGLIGMMTFCSCNSGVVYENYTDLPSNQWHADSVIRFEFDIINTSESYNLYYNIRHTLAYPYYNLYVQYSLHPKKKRTEWTRKDGNLMHPTTGVPLGQGTSDLYNCRFPILENYKFEQKGTYIFELKQDMRLDTLPEVSAVGFRIEKNKQP